MRWRGGNEPKGGEPSEKSAEVVAGGGEDGICGVAVVPAHPHS